MVSNKLHNPSCHHLGYHLLIKNLLPDDKPGILFLRFLFCKNLYLLSFFAFQMPIIFIVRANCPHRITFVSCFSQSSLDNLFTKFTNDIVFPKFLCFHSKTNCPTFLNQSKHFSHINSSPNNPIIIYNWLFLFFPQNKNRHAIPLKNFTHKNLSYKETVLFTKLNSLGSQIVYSQ